MSAPGNDKIKEQLKRILDSDDFRRSERLSGFLKYVVEQTIEGKANNITGYSIGIDVFKKPKDFDSDLDSSVRVEAVRLRKALALYYHEIGKNDPIIIKVPRGGYQPVFLKQTPESNPLSHQKEKISFRSKMFLLAGIIALLAVLAYAMPLLLQKFSYKEPKNPVVAIGAFTFAGTDTQSKQQTDLVYMLNNKLSHFRSLTNIVIDPGIKDHKISYDYLLEGTISQTDSDIIVNARLLDAGQDALVWTYSQKFQNKPEKSDQDWMDDASTMIVSAIASTHGVIDTLELEKYSNGQSKHNQSYQCLLTFRAYDNNKTPKKHKQARQCLEKLVEHYPDNSIAWAYLSWIYGDEARFNFNPRAGAPTAKERALDAGLKAVETNQRDARAHMYLASAALLSNNLDLMERHIKISIDLNPYDSDILASASWKYGRIGKWELNKKYALEALHLNPSPPKWYHGNLFNYYYEVGDYDKAQFHALLNYQKDEFFSRISLIAVDTHTDLPEARKLAKETKEKFPDILNHLDKFLAVWNLNPDWQQKLSTDLKKAGLDFPPPEK